MKTTLVLLVITACCCMAHAADTTYTPRKHSIYINAGIGATLTYTSNGITTANAGLNYVYRGKHYIGAHTQVGFGFKGLVYPNRVGSFAHYQLVYGLRQHINKGRFVTPFMGVSYSRYKVSTYEYKEIELGAIEIQQELFYQQQTITSPGLVAGINFLFTRKHYGFSFEPYMVISKYTEFGIRLNVLKLGRII